jgi:hypothetical protein
MAKSVFYAHRPLDELCDALAYVAKTRLSLFDPQLVFSLKCWSPAVCNRCARQSRFVIAS